jgi:YidC/Oxa1 family membrane protein insertase
MKLYQQAGINPASGCLFLIIQMPIFIALYQTLSLFLIKGNLKKVIFEINKVVYLPMLKVQSIDPWFFGFNLGLSPAKAAGQWQYYLIPLITAVLQYFQAQTAGTATPVAIPEEKKEEKKADSLEDFQKAMNMQMKYFFPLMIGYFSYTLPVGLSLYWNIFSIFSIIQYRQIQVKNSK